MRGVISVRVPRDGVGLLLFTLLMFCLIALSPSIGYPKFIYSSVVIVCLQLYLASHYGLVSIPSLFMSLLAYPSLLPFLGRYVFHTDLYALRAADFHTEYILNKSIFVVALFALSYVAVLRIVETMRRQSSPQPGRIWFRYRRLPFVGLSTLHVLSAYLTTPGPTVLTADYATVLESGYAWAVFAGATYLGTWTILFLMINSEDAGRREYWSFLFITFLGVGWLLLHARRNETLGILIVLVIHHFKNQVDTKIVRTVGSITSIGLIVVAAQVVSRLRGQGLAASDIGFRAILTAEYPVRGTVMAVPGGAHNILSTLMVTVSMFDGKTEPLWGTSFVRYVPAAIPSGVYSLLPVNYPMLFFDRLRDVYPYGGGNFIINVYYANLGLFGVVLGGCLLAVLVHFARRHLVSYPSTGIYAAGATVIILASFRALWYTQLNWIDNLQGLFIGYVLYNIFCRVELLLSSGSGRGDQSVPSAKHSR